MSAAAEHLANDPRSELWGEHRARYRFAARWAAGCRVLDVACGAGFGVQMLDCAGARTIGVDLDARALAEARVLGPSAHLVRADGARLPLPDGCVDLVTSFETLEHVADAAALLSELRRVLRPGGRLVLSTPNRAFGAHHHGHADHPGHRSAGQAEGDASGRGEAHASGGSHALAQARPAPEPPSRPANPFHVREFTTSELRELLGGVFDHVELLAQRPSPAYRYVPYLLVGRHREPAAVAWKVLNRLPWRLKNAAAVRLSGRPFYPGETDYQFEPHDVERSHVLVAVAWTYPAPRADAGAGPGGTDGRGRSEARGGADQRGALGREAGDR